MRTVLFIHKQEATQQYGAAAEVPGSPKCSKGSTQAVRVAQERERKLGTLQRRRFFLVEAFCHHFAPPYPKTITGRAWSQARASVPTIYLSLTGMTSVMTTSGGTPLPRRLARRPAGSPTPAEGHSAVSPPTPPSFSGPSPPPPRDGGDDGGGNDDTGLVSLVHLPLPGFTTPFSIPTTTSPVLPPPREGSGRQGGRASCGSCL